MSKTPTVDECLMTSPTAPSEKRGLPRNLHWVIIGLVIAALAVVIFGSAIDAEKVDKEELAKQQTAERHAAMNISKPTDVRTVLEIQGEQESKIPDAISSISKLPPVPEEGETQNGGSAVGASGDPEAAKMERERLAREQQRKETIASSGLLAIRGRALRDMQGAEQRERLSGKEEALNARDEALANIQKRKTEALQGLTQRQSTQSMGMAGAGATGGAQGGNPFAPKGQQHPSNANSSWLASQQGQSSGVINVEYPASQSVLIQGTTIPVALITALNSDMPGQIVAMATSDVYDSILGKHLIIPRGSKFYGSYNSEVRIGQERALAAFQRMVRPDGTSVNLMGMPAADSIGQGGLPGDVDNHFLKMFGASFMTAGLAAIFDRSGDQQVVIAGGGTGSSALRGAAGDILVDIARRTADRNVTIPPTITVPAGEKFVITVTKDIDIPPYRGKLPGQ